MAAIGSGIILVGVLAAVVGVGGFVDTRKVDRRFKTGYRNNEPDNRNFGRAAKRVLYGIGICIVGAAVNNLTPLDGVKQHGRSATTILAGRRV
jgi:hypothetical protein